MSYKLKVTEAECFGAGKYKNDKGNTECVVFVQAVTNAPETGKWAKGVYVKTAKAGDIPRGTAIATFDANGKYPSDALGKHAAIYLSHDANGITVLDQWNSQGEVRQRVIRFDQPEGTRRSNNGDTFYVVE